MSSEKHNTSKQTPQPDWRLEIDKYWKQVSEKPAIFLTTTKACFPPARLPLRWEALWP